MSHNPVEAAAEDHPGLITAGSLNALAQPHLRRSFTPAQRNETTPGGWLTVVSGTYTRGPLHVCYN